MPRTTPPPAANTIIIRPPPSSRKKIWILTIESSTNLKGERAKMRRSDSSSLIRLRILALSPSHLRNETILVHTLI